MASPAEVTAPGRAAGEMEPAYTGLKGCALCAAQLLWWWVPLLSAAVGLLVLAGDEVQHKRYPTCTVAVVPWALTAGSAAIAVAVVALIHGVSTLCVVVCVQGGEDGDGVGDVYHPKLKRDGALCGRRGCGCVVERVNVDTANGDGGTGPALFLLAASTVLAAFLVAWSYVGAVWFIAAREQGHACPPALMTLSYVLSLTVVVASLVAALLTAVAACCTAMFAVAIGAAVRSLVHSALVYLGVSSNGATSTTGHTRPAGHPSGAAYSLVGGDGAASTSLDHGEDIDYPEPSPATLPLM